MKSEHIGGILCRQKDAVEGFSVGSGIISFVL